MAAEVKDKTVCDILFNSGDSFRHYMTQCGYLKRVVPSMMEKKLINKRILKHCMKKEDADLLLAEMKHNMTLTNFIGYLEVLTEIGSAEDYNGETRKLMRLMKGSLAEVKPGLNPEHDAVIKRFLEVAFSDTSSPTAQTQLEVPQLQVQMKVTSISSTQEEIVAEGATATKTTAQAPDSKTDPKPPEAETETTPEATAYSGLSSKPQDPEATKTVFKPTPNIAERTETVLHKHTAIASTGAPDQPPSGKTVGNVVFENGDSLKHYMSKNLEKLVPQMVKKKVLGKKLGKAFQADTSAELLLAHMKHKLSLEKFLGYLDIMTEFGMSEKYEGETKYVMRLMSSSLKAMNPEPNSRHESVIEQFIAVAFSDQLQSQTEEVQIEEVQHQTHITSQHQTHITSVQSTITEQDVTSEDTTIASDLYTISPTTAVPTETLSQMSDPSTISQTTAVPTESLTQASDSSAISHASRIKPSETLSSEPMSDSHPLHKRSASTGAPGRPPPGQLGEALSHTFTHEGGMLYSPIHGVCVTVPPNAIPTDVDKLFLSMHFYLGHPFDTEGASVCSVVVWFHHYPRVEFLEDVTVKIPHAARADSASLCVLTWGEDKQGPPYTLDTHVSADFSNGYHAVFKLTHFSPYAVAKTRYNSTDAVLHKTLAFRKRTGTGSGSGSFKSLERSLERMDSDSVKNSIDDDLVVIRSDSTNGSLRQKLLRQEAMDTGSPLSASLERNGSYDSGVNYSIACSMPRDRSGGQWEVLVAACYSHPTGNWVLRQSTEEKLGADIEFYLQEDIRIKGGCIQLSVRSGDLTVSTDTGQILEEQIQNVPDISLTPNNPERWVFKGLGYPPSVSFTVTADRESGQPTPQLSSCIEAQGAVTASGETPSFPVTSTKPTRKGLSTCSYLYGANSEVLQTLRNPSRDLVLNTQDRDQTKLLADISLQLHTDQLKCLSLLLGTDNIEKDPLEILGDWVCSKLEKGEAVKLADLLRLLKLPNIEMKDSDPSPLVKDYLDQQPIPTSSDSELLRQLAVMLQLCWKEIGYLMGISLFDITCISKKYGPDLFEQTVQLLSQWQRREDAGATWGTLFKAVHRTFRYYPSRVNDAHNFCVSNVNNHPELLQPTPPPPTQE